MATAAPSQAGDSCESAQQLPRLGLRALFNMLQVGGGFVLVDCRGKEEHLKSHIVRSVQIDVKAALEDEAPLSMAALSESHVDVLDRPGLLRSVILYGGEDSPAGHTFEQLAAWLLVQQKEYFNPRVLDVPFSSFERAYPFLCAAGVEFSQLRASYPNEVYPNFLWLGSRRQAASKELLDNLRIDRVWQFYDEGRDPTIVGCGEGEARVEEKYINIEMNDREDRDISVHFDRAVSVLAQWEREGRRVLVHCNQGVSRSSTIVILYCMFRDKMRLAEARDFVHECRPVVHPNRGFMTALRTWERDNMLNPLQVWWERLTAWLT